MIIRKNIPKALALNEPIRHNSHRRPVSRRDFISQGFMTGTATVFATPLLAALLKPGTAYADAALANQVVQDLDPNGLCGITQGAGKIPFIAFDLSGGANIAGSNVLVGTNGGQLNFLSTAGYSKLGLPGNMIPNASTTGNTFINSNYGLAYHSDSAHVRGMALTAVTAGPNTNGFVIPAMSQNDTQNNPHNPMYGIARIGARGQFLTLIGSVNSDSGGSSMAPVSMVDLAIRPTTITQPRDATGLADTGSLSTLFPTSASTAAVMESIERLSLAKLNVTNTKLGDALQDAAIKQQVDCGYTKAAYMAAYFDSPAALDPTKDPNVTKIFAPVGGIGADGEFAKTATIMKLVIDGMAGAGTIQMGGFDYHTGDRSSGEARDFRAGICIGACLEYAAAVGKPVMIYVFSDGSLNSNGMIDNSTGGRGKGVWTGDNQSTACSYALVYNPLHRASPIKTTLSAIEGPQLGSFQMSGDVNSAGSPAANSVTALVDMVLLNYLALHGEQGKFAALFPTSPLVGQIDTWTAFNPIVTGTVPNYV
ncbi:MAG: hypothetical protein ABUL58_01985 [Steroidobacter sp.]